MFRQRTAAMLVLILLAACTLGRVAAAANQGQLPSGCAVTTPPNPPFAPPVPYPAETNNGHFWFGTEKLWTQLPSSGTWALAHYDPTQSAFRQKMLWYRQGFNGKAEPYPKLIVIGRRLDASAPPLDIDGPNGAWSSRDPAQSFIVVALNIPTTGCWEISGTYGEDKLSFIVWVVDGSLSTSSGQ